MDGTIVWDIVKTLVSWAWMPVYWYMPFKNSRDSREAVWRDSMEHRVALTESNDKLREEQIRNLKETLQETKSSIKEVKQGIDKLIDRLIK